MLRRCLGARVLGNPGRSWWTLRRCCGCWGTEPTSQPPQCWERGTQARGCIAISPDPLGAGLRPLYRYPRATVEFSFSKVAAAARAHGGAGGCAFSHLCPAGLHRSHEQERQGWK